MLVSWLSRLRGGSASTGTLGLCGAAEGSTALPVLLWGVLHIIGRGFWYLPSCCIFLTMLPDMPLMKQVLRQALETAIATHVQSKQLGCRIPLELAACFASRAVAASSTFPWESAQAVWQGECCPSEP